MIRTGEKYFRHFIDPRRFKDVVCAFHVCIKNHLVIERARCASARDCDAEMDDRIHTLSCLYHTLEIGYIGDQNLIRRFNFRHVAVEKKAEIVSIPQITTKGTSNKACSACFPKSVDQCSSCDATPPAVARWS